MTEEIKTKGVKKFVVTAHLDAELFRKMEYAILRMEIPVSKSGYIKYLIKKDIRERVGTDDRK